MRAVIVTCAALLACSSQSQNAACPAPAGAAYTGDCRTGGLAALGIDGDWHMVGSAHSGYGPIGGGSDSETTRSIDEVVSIQVDACAANLHRPSVTYSPDTTMLADDTALTYVCDHEGPYCIRGTLWWSICVRDYDGAVRYYSRGGGTTGMGTESFSDELDYLTR